MATTRRPGIPQHRRISRSLTTTGQFSSDFRDSEVVPSSLSQIANILRVAKEIEGQNPRVAYLCRFYAFEKAHRLDPHSRGRGVRQFKTALIQRLERDEEKTALQRSESSDAKEISKFYRSYYEDYVKALSGAEQKDRAELAKAYLIAGVLFEVLNAVNNDEVVGPEIIAASKDVDEKKEIYAAYNILPLDEDGASLSIMKQEEMVVLTVYSFLYGRLYLALSGLETSLVAKAELTKNIPLEAALAAQSLIQLGLLMVLPMVMEIGLEGGFWKAVSDFIVMQLQLASVFFTFALGTKTHFFGRTILHGGAKYHATGRGFVVRHEKFAENYRLYSRSHFTKGLELVVLLLIYSIYVKTSKGLISYILVTSMWFLVASWLFGPFLFNPSGFEWQKIVDDWDDSNQWVKESWWNEEQDHLKYTGLLGRLWEVLLALRFLLYQYGLIYHLNIVKGNKQIEVYGLSWLVIAALLFLLKVVTVGRQRFGADFQLLFRLLKTGLFLVSLSILAGLLFVFAFTFSDLFTCLLAFLPTGWALLQVLLNTRTPSNIIAIGLV